MKVEDWMKNTINGQIASKMVDIVNPRGEHVCMSDDFDQRIEYQGRKFNVGLIVTGVKVGDIPDDDDYTYVIYLGDFAVCKEFRDATIKLQEERGFSIELSDDIDFTDCVLALGEEYKGLGDAISKVNSALLKYSDGSHWSLRDFIYGLCELSLGDYSVVIDYHRLYLNVHNPIPKWDLINKKPSFIEVMEKIKEYFEVNNVDEILSRPANRQPDAPRRDYHDGVVCIGGAQFKYGFINEEGELVIPFTWKVACGFSEGLARVEDRYGMWGFIDKTGAVVIPCTWKYADDFSEGLAKVGDANGKYGFIDKTGAVVIPCTWEDINDFSEGLAKVKDDEWKYGFINKRGTVVCPCLWREIGCFSEGLAKVRDDNRKYGFIDKTGAVVIPCTWKYADDFSEGLARVEDRYGMWGFIDKTGAVVIPCTWEYADDFSEGLAKVGDANGKWYKIDKMGMVVE